MNIKKNIPNTLTSMNLLCGCFAIVFIFQDELVWSSYMVGIAAVIDFLDGFVARMLNAYSALGKELDSLADMVTFGVVPGMQMFFMIKYALILSFVPQAGEWNANTDALSVAGFLPFLSFIIPVFSALRLAKFNIDTRQTDSFIGLPTPANALFIGSIPLFVNFSLPGWHTVIFSQEPSDLISELFREPVMLIILTIILSFLLVSPLPLFALKFKNFRWKGNEFRYILLGSSLVMLIIFGYMGIPFIIILYIILSLIQNYYNKKGYHEIQS